MAKVEIMVKIDGVEAELTWDDIEIADPHAVEQVGNAVMNAVEQMADPKLRGFLEAPVEYQAAPELDIEGWGKPHPDHEEPFDPWH